MSKRATKLLRVAPQFAGELAEPIMEDLLMVIAALPDDSSDAEIETAVDAAIRRARRRQLAKLGKLLAFYKIDPKHSARWLLLSLKLAADFVPGMKIHFLGNPRKRGRPPKWQGKRAAELVQAVERIKAERQKGVADAVRILQIRQPDVWGSPGRGEKKNVASLVARYYEASAKIRAQSLPASEKRELLRKRD
ncbi:hypothetical protein [Bradyrhizobium sp.]|uniref:hypothetical protein n=1 Tax=Bradyrhizobium sp. TaxID=376 RepID=UPI002D4EEF84|nr:hypothetical protein [Bradyrhizobium sp.]HZR76997.1 hypothetical protein [Bradyrhizobium sp.]